MASAPVGQMLEARSGSLLLDCVAANGSRSHPYAWGPALTSGPEAGRNLADAIHFLCALHGRHPSLVELVAMRSLEPEARDWLGAASETFARERGFLARLAVAAGPAPTTPGGGAAATVATQRAALTTLAQSERRGCALGAAFALMLDWAVIREMLQAAAERFALPPLYVDPIDPAAVDAACEAVCRSVALRRAVLFGAEQVALQQRGLWELLWARALARGTPPA